MNDNLIKNFRKKLKQKNQMLIGGWIQICEPAIVEIMCSYKFDWITFDLEHGLFSTKNLSNLVRAAELSKKVKLARLPNHNKDFCSLVLDSGCDGVIIPNIKNEIELTKMRNLIYYPPIGKRGVGFSRENLFSKNFEKHAKKTKKPILISMIENKEGVKNLKKILKVKGLDGILIGPYDLSASLNITGKFENSLFKETINKIKKLSKEAGVPVGLHVLDNNFSSLKKLKQKGFNFFPYCTDAMLLNKAIKNSLNKNK
jgi:2-dehydro-3-deoxyglucarate aldolase